MNETIKQVSDQGRAVRGVRVFVPGTNRTAEVSHMDDDGRTYLERFGGPYDPKTLLVAPAFPQRKP